MGGGGGAWTSSVPFDPPRLLLERLKLKGSAGDEELQQIWTKLHFLLLLLSFTTFTSFKCHSYLISMFNSQTFGVYSLLFYRPTFSSINTSFLLLFYSFISFFSFLFILSYFCVTVDIYERRDLKFPDVSFFRLSSLSFSRSSPVMGGAPLLHPFSQEPPPLWGP